jgi:hypothetical protein
MISTGIGANIFSLYRSLMNCLTKNINTIEIIEIIRVAMLVSDMWLNISIISFDKIEIDSSYYKVKDWVKLILL